MRCLGSSVLSIRSHWRDICGHDRGFLGSELSLELELRQGQGTARGWGCRISGDSGSCVRRGGAPVPALWCGGFHLIYAAHRMAGVSARGGQGKHWGIAPTKLEI